MKTIEEKAKAYDEALERARSLSCSSEYEGYKKIFENIFPELAESEDEKIRKALIKLVKQAGEGYEYITEGVSIQKAVAYLEKQGEQKPVVRKFRIGDTIKHKSGDDTYYTIVDIVNDSYMCNNNHSWSISSQDYFELVEQKPVEWSEEDERLFEDIEEAISKSTWGEYDKKLHISFLKHFRPQPKQEWSEEDEKLYNDLSDTYFYNDEDYPEETYKLMLKRVLDWMTKRAKSLRPQNHWKPSDEQIMVLNEVINHAAESEKPHWNDYIYNILKRLREQLKKLMEG